MHFGSYKVRDTKGEERREKYMFFFSFLGYIRFLKKLNLDHYKCLKDLILIKLINYNKFSDVY